MDKPMEEILSRHATLLQTLLAESFDNVPTLPNAVLKIDDPIPAVSLIPLCPSSDFYRWCVHKI